MKRQMIRTMVGTLFLIGSTCTAVWAMDGPPVQGRHMGPPPEAIEACRDKPEGTAVEFTNRRGETVKATCTLIEGQLLAVPENGFRGPGGRRGHMGPPPEAIEACKDKTEGTAVEFTNRRGETVKATCKQVHDRLVAVPEGWPGGRSEMPPPKTKSGE